MKHWLKLVRPFTLFPPLLGILSGAVCAFGSAHNPDPARRITWPILVTVAIGSLCASAMNAASNIVNQIADLEIDRRNKPDRPLVRGEVSIGNAWIVAAALYVLAILPTWLVVPYPYHSFTDRLAAPVPLPRRVLHLLDRRARDFRLFISGVRTLEAPLVLGQLHHRRHARRPAEGRGLVLRRVGRARAEPWAIGGIFALFLLGATSTKDFSDMVGDREHGVITLPIRFGVARAARMMAPFFVLPWLAIPILARMPDPDQPGGYLLTGNRTLLTILGLGLAAWGAYTARLLLANPDELARTENHPAWTHMYLLLMSAQVGFALAYAL